jgi:hypothetical protein
VKGSEGCEGYNQVAIGKKNKIKKNKKERQGKKKFELKQTLHPSPLHSPLRPNFARISPEFRPN